MSYKTGLFGKIPSAAYLYAVKSAAMYKRAHSETKDGFIGNLPMFFRLNYMVFVLFHKFTVYVLILVLFFRANNVSKLNKKLFSFILFLQYTRYFVRL